MLHEQYAIVGDGLWTSLLATRIAEAELSAEWVARLGSKARWQGHSVDSKLYAYGV